MATPEKLPLVGHDDLAQPIAWRDGAPVSVARFLAEVEHVAGALPPGTHVLNLCEDRYRFAVAFAAAILAGKTSLLPPNRTEKALAQVTATYPGCGAVTDAPLPPLDAPRLDFPEVPAAARAPGHAPAIAADHAAAVVFTSGSTGEPQPNVKRWGKLTAGAHAEAAALALPEGGFQLLGTVPPQHMYGLESTVVLPLLLGGSMHPARPLLPADVQSALAELPVPRVLVTTPIHVRACVESGVALPELALLVSAAAPLARALAAAAERRFGTRVMEIYGCSEAGMIAARRTTATRTWRTMAGVRLVPDGDGWAFTGGHVHGSVRATDVLRPESDVAFLLEGRMRDIVNIAGKRASLGDLNHKLAEIPGVEDGVFHVPEAPDGQVVRLMAFVVAPRLSEGEIIAALRRAIDPAFLPRPLVKVARLPRAATGKLPLEALRVLEAEATR
jgi:acyl-coenzyme A synthetase/AMP-(fatty) acid ligase